MDPDKFSLTGGLLNHCTQPLYPSVDLYQVLFYSIIRSECEVLISIAPKYRYPFRARCDIRPTAINKKRITVHNYKKKKKKMLPTTTTTNAHKLTSHKISCCASCYITTGILYFIVMYLANETDCCVSGLGWPTKVDVNCSQKSVVLGAAESSSGEESHKKMKFPPLPYK